MNKGKIYSIEQIESTKNALNSMPIKISATQALLLLRKDILAAKKIGKSLSEIQTVLKNAGIEASISLINQTIKKGA